MDRFVTTLASLSLMVLAFIASAQANVAPAFHGVGQEGFEEGPTADFF